LSVATSLQAASVCAGAMSQPKDGDSVPSVGASVGKVDDGSPEGALDGVDDGRNVGVFVGMSYG